MAEQQTMTATPADTPAQPSYVQSLLSPALDGAEDAPAGSETQGEDALAVPGTSSDAAGAVTGDEKTDTAAATLPSVDDLIQTFATETGLNPEDPNQRKTLKRLADKELFIRKLQADNEVLKGTAGAGSTADAPQFVTDFEKSLVGETAQATGQPAAQAEPPAKTADQPAAAAATTTYGDVGDEWKTPEDSLKALNTAWGKDDLKAVHDIEVARMKRNFDAVIAPSLLSYINKMVEARLKGFAEKDLGDVLPEVRRTVAQRRVGESREFAIDQLRSAGANDIDKLFTAEDGPPIKFGDQEFPNTPLNRILARHPEIMQIAGTHTDPTTRERQAMIARYKLAYQIYKQGAAGVSAETAKALVDAGREIRTRQDGDRARQSINAGPGASGVGDKPPREKSYVTQLNSLPGEVPFASLIS
jgi:hypothetical protein